MLVSFQKGFTRKMKTAKYALLISLVCGGIFLCGCKPDQSDPATNAANGTDTNSVATNSPATNADGTVTQPPPPSINAVTSDTGTAFDLKTMQVKLTTELSQNGKVVFLGRGLYFFAVNETEAFDTVSSYLREHTNLLSIAVFSAKENYDNVWYVANGNIDLRGFPSSLNISNGIFAILRDR